MATTFSNKCKVLAEIYIDKNYIDRIPFVLDEFVDTEDYSLALGYVIHNGYADINDETTRIINETFETLLQVFDIEDSGFESYKNILR